MWAKLTTSFCHMQIFLPVRTFLWSPKSNKLSNLPEACRIPNINEIDCFSGISRILNFFFNKGKLTTKENSLAHQFYHQFTFFLNNFLF